MTDLGPIEEDVRFAFGPGAGPRLGYRGELGLDGDDWLRHRVYRPALRTFHQPDPLLPQLAGASAGNPYGYAANDPLGWTDPAARRPPWDAPLT